ncbi:30S ribosomal protein S11, partial [Candidatus Pacearchaeota archaeon]
SEAVQQAAEVSEREEQKQEKAEKKKKERAGIAYIYSTSNNTIVHITDLAGNTISRVSGGMITKHSRLKATPSVAMFVAKQAAERAVDMGITKLYVRLRGRTRGSLGPGGHMAAKTLSKSFDIVSIVNTTRIPRGGPKKKGGRRGRRV